MGVASAGLSHRSRFAVDDRSEGKVPLGTNHYMLDTNEGGTNTLLHDLGVEGETNRFAVGG